MGRRVLGLLVLTAALVGCAIPAAATTAKPRVYVYGDSLMAETKPYVSFAGLAGAIHGTIGQAPCDYLRALTPRTSTTVLTTTNLLVLETAGNSSTTCMREPGTKIQMPIGSSEWEAKYRSDLDAIFALVQHYNPKAQVVLLEPPPMDPTKPLAAVRDDLLTTVYPEVAQDAAASYPMVSIVSDARDAVGGDTFTSTMSCLATETAAMGCTDGSITVRAPDGLHFCPAGLGSNRYPCSLLYDPGARRFGDAIERVIRARV